MESDHRRIEQLLRAHGLRPAKARRVILQHLSQRSYHPTAEQIRGSLRRNGQALSTATVYQNLTRPAAEGLLEADMPDKEELKKRLEERKQKYEAFLKAFEGDTFDAKTLFVDDEYTADGMGLRMERMVKAAKAFVPILTEEQRGQLADKLLKYSNKMGRSGLKK